jgi:outer membrane receptor protein involved in Fe transport
MMCYVLIIISLFFGVTSYGSDNHGVVKGKVSDKMTSEPLPGVYVVYGKGLGTVTDINGNYEIIADSGKLSIIYKFVGYKSVTREVHISGSENIELNIGLEQEINEMDQIVVSANRTGERVSELTVSATILKPLALSVTHITNAQELINKTSGIEVLDGQASIRGGSGFSYGAGSRVLTLIDGLPMLSPDAGNVKWQFLPLENLSQVEIIKGASSVLYGSSALNGIINFRTADATNVPVTHFYIETGIYDKPRQKNWVWWDSPRIFSSASFSHLKKIGNTDIGIGSTLLYDNGYRRLNNEKLGRLNFRIKHFDKKVTGLTYGLNVNTGYTEKTDFLLWENAKTGALKNADSTSQELHGNFFAFDPFITLNKPEKYRHELKIRIQSTQNKFPAGGSNNSNALSIFAEYQLWIKLFNRIDLTAGFSDYNSKVVSNFYGDHEGLNIAGFAQSEMRLFKRLKLSAGLRVEQNSLDKEHDKIIPIFRTGLNYQVSQFTFLRASFGQGYRFPAIAEKYANTTLGSITIYPDPYVKAESGWSSEIGIMQQILAVNLTGQADVAAFYSENSNMIEYIFGLYPDPVTGVFSYGFTATNVENSRVYGLETEFTLNRSVGEVNFAGTGGYTFIYPVEFNQVTGKSSDKYLKYRRKHSLKINFVSDYKKIELGLTIFVKSKILNIDDVFLGEMTRESILPGFYDYWMNDNKAYFLADVNLGYNISEHYSLSLAVKNLTNTEYMGRPGDIMPQRNFSLRFSGKF